VSTEDKLVVGRFQETALYQSGVKGSVIQVASTLATVPELVNAALLPLRVLVVESEAQYREWLIDRLAEKLKDVSPEEIIFPSPHVAGPAYESLRFTAREPELREMLVGLLASSMRSDKSALTRPSFVGFVQAMEGADARVLKALAQGQKAGFLDISVSGEAEKASWLSTLSLVGVRAGLENAWRGVEALESLETMGLCALIRGAALAQDDEYASIESHPNFKQAIEEIEQQAGESPDRERGIVELTRLGRLFVQACIEP
jgi:hypothetical protein